VVQQETDHDKLKERKYDSQKTSFVARRFDFQNGKGGEPAQRFHLRGRERRRVTAIFNWRRASYVGEQIEAEAEPEKNSALVPQAIAEKSQRFLAISLSET